MTEKKGGEKYGLVILTSASCALAVKLQSTRDQAQRSCCMELTFFFLKVLVSSDPNIEIRLNQFNTAFLFDTNASEQSQLH